MSVLTGKALPIGISILAVITIARFTIFRALSTPLLKRMYRNKWVPPKDLTSMSFKGQTVIITGANVGLGFEAAVKFASLGASRLILGVRSSSKGEKAKRAIESRAKEPNCQIDVWEVDMDSYDSIKAFVKRVETDLERLDVAVLNAGVWRGKHSRSKYGWEAMIQINTLSTTLLALLLLPVMKGLAARNHEAPVPVLEIVSSGTHQTVQMSKEKQEFEGSLIEEFSKETGFQGRRNYALSKLFLMCAWPELKAMATSSTKASSPDVWIPTVCPGACQSQLARDANTPGLRAAKVIASLIFLRTTEEGSRTFLSGTQLGEEGNAGMWQNDKIQPTASALKGERGEKFQKRVWRDILEALRKDVPEIVDTVGAYTST